jgi:NADH:ubiquinone oxidoreductase subunit 2 (subunit N)
MIVVTVLNLAVYFFTMLFFVLLLLSISKARPITTFSDLAKCTKKNTLLFLAFTCIFFSFAGAPPFLGFTVKLSIFKVILREGIHSNFFLLIYIILLISSVNSLYYYFKLYLNFIYLPPKKLFSYSNTGLSRKRLNMLEVPTGQLGYRVWFENFFLNGFYLLIIAILLVLPICSNFFYFNHWFILHF